MAWYGKQDYSGFDCLFPCYTSTKSVIFSLQFVFVRVSVCPAMIVNKIPAERMYQFGHDFRYMDSNCTGSSPIEIGDPDGLS